MLKKSFDASGKAKVGSWRGQSKAKICAEKDTKIADREPNLNGAWGLL
jgi:hypothetical protein